MVNILSPAGSQQKEQQQQLGQLDSSKGGVGCYDVTVVTITMGTGWFEVKMITNISIPHIPPVFSYYSLSFMS